MATGDDQIIEDLLHDQAQASRRVQRIVPLLRAIEYIALGHDDSPETITLDGWDDSMLNAQGMS